MDTASPTQEKTRLSLFKLRDLPLPGPMAQETLRIMGNDDVELQEVVSVVEKSPELTARLLRCANSAYYGQRRHIYSVREAVIRVLGLGITKSLALALALGSNFTPSQKSGLSSYDFWLDAVLTATLSQKLVKHLKSHSRPVPATIYTAGLLHNLGLLGLSQAFPDTVKEHIKGFPQVEMTTLESALEQNLGLTSAQAGGYLAEHWGLPTALVNAITYHRCPEHIHEHWTLSRLIGISSQIVPVLLLQQPKSLSEDLPECHNQDLLPVAAITSECEQLQSQLPELEDLAGLLQSKGDS